jgi:hypothetical protein
VVLKTKGHEKTLQQQKQQESAVANVAVTQTIQTAIVSQDTKQIEVLNCIHYNKLYHNVQKCYILYPKLKNSNNKKRKPKRQRVKTSNESNGLLIGLVAYFGIAATSDTNSLFYTQWIIDITCSYYITHSREHFVLYTLIAQSLTIVKGLAGASVTLIKISTVKIRCKIKGKTQAIKLTNVYYVLDGGVNLISVNQLFKIKATVNFSL